MSVPVSVSVGRRGELKVRLARLAASMGSGKGPGQAAGLLFRSRL